LTQSAAQTACQQRNNSFLPRVTNLNIQSKLRQFRSTRGALSLLHSDGFWIDVKSAGIGNWHWVDGSQLAGWLIALPFVCRLSVCHLPVTLVRPTQAIEI